MATDDFLHRFAQACVHRWGLVIEFLIDVCLRALRERSDALTCGHFVRAFSARTSYPKDIMPFTGPDDASLFGAEMILACFDLSGQRWD